MSYTSTFHGYSVRFSPFDPHLVALATAHNFGIVGNGTLHVLRLAPPPSPHLPHTYQPVAIFETRDGIYDVAWSEESPTILVAAGGDGSLKVYDIALPASQNPVRAYAEHRQEVQSVRWNPGPIRRDTFVTTSWDDTARIWSLQNPTPQALRVLSEHAYCVYDASWCPTDAEVSTKYRGTVEQLVLIYVPCVRPPSWGVGVGVGVDEHEFYGLTMDTTPNAKRLNSLMFYSAL